MFSFLEITINTQATQRQRILLFIKSLTVSRTRADSDESEDSDDVLDGKFSIHLVISLEQHTTESCIAETLTDAVRIIESVLAGRGLYNKIPFIYSCKNG